MLTSTQSGSAVMRGAPRNEVDDSADFIAADPSPESRLGLFACRRHARRQPASQRCSTACRAALTSPLSVR